MGAPAPAAPLLRHLQIDWSGPLAGKMRVAVIDADPKQAVSRWTANAYEGPDLDVTAEADETRLAHLIAAKVDTADLVLVDTAGFGNRAATIAITSANAVLIPRLRERQT